MTVHTIDVSARVADINCIELLAALKASDALAECSLLRNSSGKALTLQVQTTGSLLLSQATTILNAHVPTKTEAQTVSAATETAFREQVTTKLADTDFKSFVETELSKLGGK